jgi:hypothetical protein
MRRTPEIQSVLNQELNMAGVRRSSYDDRLMDACWPNAVRPATIFFFGSLSS